MLEQIVRTVPERWREMIEVAVTPIIWIPPMQRAIAQFFLATPSPWMAAVKYVLFFFPLVLWVVLIWCTQCSLYTLPFRSRRQAFVSTMLVMWWDAARAVALYWVGLLRLAVVLAGWSLLLLGLGTRLMVRGAVQVARMPFKTSRRMTQSYREPGVPWVAVFMFRLWCSLEASLFTSALFPAASRVLATLMGGPPHPLVVAPVLYLFLLLLIMASFAGLQGLADAIKTRQLKWVAPIVVVELFVMVFEARFLGQMLAVALAPWLTGGTSGTLRLGTAFFFAVAVSGWIGVRGTTWILFGQFGTPSMRAFIARRPVVEQEVRPIAEPAVSETSGWRAELEELRRETGWLHEKSDELLEYLALPVLTVLAVALNLGMVLVTARPVFSLPFKGLKAVMETGDIAALSPPSRKGATA
jgi:hypothetical protein